MNYYNENDPKAAAWLRELIKADLISRGEVDERSIEDVCPSDLRGFKQCHFFAGIGGWSYALRLAGWPDDEPVWTGSCPCQPFSAAGKRKGTSDERHLWPAWHWLIRESRPHVIFGEQVASKDGIAWLDTVSSDLEGEGYTCGPVVFPACGVGAPHKRERLWFVADSDGRNTCAEREQRGREQRQQSANSGAMRVEHAPGLGWLERWAESGGRSVVGGRGENGLGHSAGPGCLLGKSKDRQVADGSLEKRGEANRRDQSIGGTSPANGFWSDAGWINCTDGRQRAIKPGTFPLAHGVSARVAKLRGIGNAIVPQAAAEVIMAYVEARAILSGEG